VNVGDYQKALDDANTCIKLLLVFNVELIRIGLKDIKEKGQLFSI
jgi:hypothetical protein